RAHGLFPSGDSHRAIESGQRGLAIAEALEDPYLQESANFYLAQVCHWVGNYRRGVELLGRNVTTLETELKRRGVDSKQCVNSRTFLAWCLAELGEFAAATVLIFLGEACLLAGRIDEARHAASRALELSAERAEQGWQAWGLRLMGDVAAQTDAGRAEDAYRRGLALASALGMQPLVAHCHLGLGGLHRRGDKPREAGEHLDAAITLLRRLDMTRWL